MQQGKNSVSFLIRFVIVFLLTPMFFLLLGTFYKAYEHSIALNIIVWFVTTLVSYYSYFTFHTLLRLIFKKWSKAPIFDGWSILSGLAAILVICLFQSKEVDDFLYVEVMGALSGIIAFFQIMFEILVKKHLKPNNEDK